MQDTPFRYCPGCGRPGISWTEGKKAECPACGYIMYVNAATATACFITRGPLALFAVRAHDPGRGMLDLPGGFVDPGESATAGLARELREELGLAPDEGRLDFLFSFPNRYPYRTLVYDTCDLFFRLELGPEDPEPVAADDVAALVWRDPAGVRPEELAFDSMRRAVAAFIARMAR
jgi:ADP-ribose pyrophosphatase YjhB (NUDIX family)